MLSYIEPVIIAAAFALAWDYRQPEPLLFGRIEVAPVTLEEQRATEWLAQLRTPATGRHASARIISQYRVGIRRRGTHVDEYTARHYRRD